MTLTYRVEPIGPWPGALPAGQRKTIPFRATWADTLVLLGDELGKLRASDVVLQVDVRDGDVRRDGMLRADARMGAFPGARVSFDSRHGPLTYATDMYEGRWSGQMPDWQANIRAIALSLQALRAVDRYGVTKRGEQYQGWKALEAGPTAPTLSGLSNSEAAALLLRVANYPGPPEARLSAVYRRARANAHPDRNSGDRTLWDEVEAAAAQLQQELDR